MNPAVTGLHTWGAIFIECAIGILVLCKFRYRMVSLVLAVALHVFIIVTIGLWSFALVMVGAVAIAAAPSARADVWDAERVATFTKRRAQVTSA